jgi:hypothetical protein
MGVLLVLCKDVFAEEKTYHFDAYNCHSSFKYNPAEYSKDKLDNTINLIFSTFDPLSHSALPSLNADDYIKFDFAKLDRDCADSLGSMSQREFIPLAGIEDYRRSMIDEAKDQCAFENILVRGFSNPSVLRTYQPATQACSIFVDALEEKINLESFYRRLYEAGCSGYEDPTQCLALGKGISHRVYILDYGWRMCALPYMKDRVESEPIEKQRLQLEAQFRHLFKVKKSKCWETVD